MKIDDKKYRQEKTKISNNLLVPLLIPALLTTIMELESIIIEKLDPNDLMGARGNGRDALLPYAPVFTSAVNDAVRIWCAQIPILSD